MTGPFHSDYGHPGFTGLFNTNIDREGCHSLTKALMSIDNCDCACIDLYCWYLVGLEFALAHPVKIPHDTDYAVAVVSSAI
jgi:hypothetical protein